MNPEKQRIAIAEACGWKTTSNSPNWTYYRPDGRGWNGDLPNYLSDLNAMHEAEKVLTDWIQYEIELTRIWHLNESGRLKNFLIHANAAQRAEAFLRTLNLWEE